MDETTTPDPQAAQDAPTAGSSPEPLTLTGSATDFDDLPPPSLGRTVHFVNGFDEERAAIITQVEEDGSVRLCSWRLTGVPEPISDPVPYDAEGGPFTWHWPERI